MAEGGSEFGSDARLLAEQCYDPVFAYVAGAAQVKTGVQLPVIWGLLRVIQSAYQNRDLSDPEKDALLHLVYLGQLGDAKTSWERISSAPLLVQHRSSSSSLAFEHHGSFSNLVDIDGKHFAHNPYTDEIISNTDAEVIEKMVLQQILDEKKQRERDEALAHELEREELAQAEALRSQEEVLPTCRICMDVIVPEEMQPLDNCGHMFHAQCIGKYFEVQISESQFPIICPVETCKMEVTMADLRERLSPEMVAKFEDFSFNQYVSRNKAALITCPSPNCKYVFLFNNESSFQCPLCAVTFCLRCMTEYHQGMTCEEFRATKDVNALDSMFAALVKGQKFKQCPQCKFWVERTTGCDHMRCRCGGEFCYKCGGPYRNCFCPDKAAELHVIAPIRRRRFGFPRSSS